MTVDSKTNWLRSDHVERPDTYMFQCDLNVRSLGFIVARNFSKLSLGLFVYGKVQGSLKLHDKHGSEAVRLLFTENSGESLRAKKNKYLIFFFNSFPFFDS